MRRLVKRKLVTDLKFNETFQGQKIRNHPSIVQGKRDAISLPLTTIDSMLENIA